MITSLEEYVTLLEHDENAVRRTAVSEEANAITRHAILENRPDLSPNVAMNKNLPAEIVTGRWASGMYFSEPLIGTNLHKWDVR